jgi:putative aminopeptidase FrvX
MEFLKRLTETAGVPGREERVRELIREHTDGWWDELKEDAIGNLIGTVKAAKRKRGQKERSVVLACHLDQIGFYVRYIDDDGFLRVQHAGGFDTRNLFARRVSVITKSGDFPGVLNPATKPIHVATAEERNHVPTVAEFAVDLGMSAKKVKRLVRPGDPIVLQQTTELMGDLVCGQAMDNRISPWVALNAIEKAKGQNTYDITFLGSAQEEVGLRGATVAAQAIDAEVAIAVDVTLAVDVPGAKKEEAISRLGDGVAIKVMDSATISTHSLVEEFVALAQKKRIKFQYEILPLGGTDASALQRFGRDRRTITLSVPCRYVHTPVETVHRKDLKAAVDLLAAWLCGGQ